MVRALLAGRKTQTRRVLKRQPYTVEGVVFTWEGPNSAFLCGPQAVATNLIDHGATTYAPGDRLYVREAHSLHNAHGTERHDGKRWGPWGGLPTAVSPDGEQIAYYREGFDRCGFSSWRPSIHMPRWASRLTLIVTDVRVQRLQEISEADAMAEGIAEVSAAWQDADEPASYPSFQAYGQDACFSGFGASRLSFMTLWNSLHGPEAWAANPWLVALTFTVQHGNIDQLAVRP